MNDLTAPRDSSVKLMVISGWHPYENKELRAFLDNEAAGFGTRIEPQGFNNLIGAVRTGKVHIVLAIVDEDTTAGAAVQFPTVFPKWDPSSGKFLFLPAIYSEDMAASREISDAFRLQHKSGFGTTFMSQRVEMAGNPHDGSFDFKHKFPASALLGEQSWPIDPTTNELSRIARLLRNFNTVMATEKDETVLLFRKPSDFKQASREVTNSRVSTHHLLIPLQHNHLIKVNDMFSSTWRVDQLAATFTLGIASFTGTPVIRTNIAIGETVPKNGSLKEGIKSLLKQGAVRAVQEGWMLDVDSAISALRIHALADGDKDKEGMKLVRAALRSLGAKERRLGNFVLHPLFMNFDKIPSSHGLTLASGTPFWPVEVTNNTNPHEPPPAASQLNGGSPFHPGSDRHLMPMISNAPPFR